VEELIPPNAITNQAHLTVWRDRLIHRSRTAENGLNQPSTRRDHSVTICLDPRSFADLGRLCSDAQSLILQGFLRLRVEKRTVVRKARRSTGNRPTQYERVPRRCLRTAMNGPRSPPAATCDLRPSHTRRPSPAVRHRRGPHRSADPRPRRGKSGNNAGVTATGSPTITPRSNCPAPPG
jgi:hypothetical protein